MLLDVISDATAGNVADDVQLDLKILRNLLGRLMVDIREMVGKDGRRGLRASIHQPLPDGYTRYVAAFNISRKKVNRLSNPDNQWNWGDEIVGVAGACATFLRPVFIPDLAVSKAENPDIKYFFDSIPKRPSGGILCVPVLHTRGSKIYCLATVSVTAQKPHILTLQHVRHIKQFEFVLELEMLRFIRDMQRCVEEKLDFESLPMLMVDERSTAIEHMEPEKKRLPPDFGEWITPAVIYAALDTVANEKWPGYQGKRGRKAVRIDRVKEVIEGRENDWISLDEYAAKFAGVKMPRNNAASFLSNLDNALEELDLDVGIISDVKRQGGEVTAFYRFVRRYPRRSS